MFTLFIMIVTMTLTIVWSLPLLFAGFFGVRLHKITGQKMKIFSKKVTVASIWVNEEPDGWVCGKWYFGYIHTTAGGERNPTTKDLYILCSNKFYKDEVDEKMTDDEGHNTKITYYERDGVFFGITYFSRSIELPSEPVMDHQLTAITQILNVYNKKKYCVCLIYGEPGTMKSMTAQYLCERLLKTNKEVCFVDSFNPTEPGDTFAKLYTTVNPSETKPLVVMLEEVDMILDRVHNGTVPINKYIPIQIKNKTDWNLSLDKFDRKLYPHVIFLMTTNKYMDYFDNMDTSYMRAGRVDLKIRFDKFKATIASA